MNRKCLVLIGFLFASIIPVFGLTDSVGVKSIEGTKYIVHRVDKGQGLYALSKRYNVSIQDIKNVNDNIEILKLDQEILVPFPKTEAKTKILIHQVNKGETLYGISKLYNVSVEDIKKWNNLADNAIKEGDEIKIIQSVIREDENAKNDEKITLGDETNKVEIPVVSSPGGIEEEGIATYIEDPTISSRKALALHRNAPIGTVIQVTNLMNGEFVFVKVVGNLPEDASQSNELIKLSKYTAKKLKIRDQLTRVKLNYFLE